MRILFEFKFLQTIRILLPEAEPDADESFVGVRCICNALARDVGLPVLSGPLDLDQAST